MAQGETCRLNLLIIRLRIPQAEIVYMSISASLIYKTIYNAWTVLFCANRLEQHYVQDDVTHTEPQRSTSLGFCQELVARL